MAAAGRAEAAIGHPKIQQIVRFFCRHMRRHEEPKMQGGVIEPHANFKAIWAPYLRYLERPNTGQNQIYPGSAIGGLYFTSDIHRPCLRSSPKVTLDMEIDAAGVKILLVELSTLLI